MVVCQVKTENIIPTIMPTYIFIVLAVMGARSDKESEMYKWLNADLKLIMQLDYLLFSSSLAYSHGTHNSTISRRVNRPSRSSERKV